MEKNLKVAPAATQALAPGSEPEVLTAPTPKPEVPAGPEAYTLPAPVLDEILKYIGRGPWLEVDQLIQYIRTNVIPVAKISK